MKKLVSLLMLAFSMPMFAQHKVHLTCSDTDASVVKYHFYSASVSGGPYTQLDSGAFAPSTCVFDDTTPVAGQKVFYIMKAENAGGDISAASPEVSVTLAPPPAAPTNPQAVQTQ